MVQYKYDAWGNHAVLDGNGADLTGENHIGNLNPFRYRGYFYDVETELYYLQTRYYDPEVGRFITIDGVEYLDPETINGLNLYAYCGNNPVMRTDPTGSKWWEDLLGWFTVALIATAAIVAIAVVGIGIIAASTTLGVLMIGAGVGALAGITGSIIVQGCTSGITNINPWKVAAAGGIGCAIGAFSAGVSIVATSIGQFAGQAIGYALSKLPVLMSISKSIISIFMTIGGAAGGLIGGMLGGAFANKIANSFVDSTAGDEYTVNNPNWIRSLLLKLFNWLN